MKSQPPRRRYPLPAVLVGITLALMGGWAAASAAAAMTWMKYPDNKDLIVAGFRNQHFHFFPPLFGHSPGLYLAAAILIVIACFAGSFYLRRRGFPLDERPK